MTSDAWDPSDSILAAFEATRADLPGRGTVAGRIVIAIVQGRALRMDRRWLDRLRALAAVARQEPDPPPGFSEADAALGAFDLMLAAGDGELAATPRSALAEVDRYAAIVGTLQPHADYVRSARLMLIMIRAGEDGDLAGIHGSPADLRELMGRITADPAFSGDPDMLAAAVDLAGALEAVARRDVDAIRAWLRRSIAWADRLPPGHPGRVFAMQLNATVAALVKVADPGGVANEPLGSRDRDELEVLRELAELPGPLQALHLMNLGTAELYEGRRSLPVLDSAIAHMRAGVDKTSVHDRHRALYLMALGGAWSLRFAMTACRADLNHAIPALEQAKDVAGSPVHGHWAEICQALGQAYRWVGRLTAGREIALVGLRGYAWGALLQSSAADAAEAARRAAAEAVKIAGWCLLDGDPSDAVGALEAGRSLILHAATQTRDVAGQLHVTGQHDLAEQWRRTVASVGVAEVAVDLRRRVLCTLAGFDIAEDGAVVGTDGAIRLLDPPSVHEIRAALVALGRDALIYLVHDANTQVGAAVVVSASDGPSWLPLPELTSLDPGQTLSGVDGRDVRPHPSGGGDSLDELCEWAWRAVVGPLLKEYLRAPADRPLRLVLVPVGELSLVPWHAAATGTGVARRYAVELVSFSYTPSARMLCESAWRPACATTPGGLVVADPDTGGQAAPLPAARDEAWAVSTSFYPSARYVGRRPDGSSGPDGAGNRDDVLRWLDEDDAGVMLHLACHGVARNDTGAADSSYLLLAGGERLSAEELVQGFVERPGREVALAVLATCGSGVSGRGYDEAFSLASALLVGGVRSVVSTQWRVPDSPTSVLMFMFHHYLCSEGFPPAEALRAAQLWMLRRDREFPAGVPDELQRRLATVDLADPMNWAAVIHFGR